MPRPWTIRSRTITAAVPLAALIARTAWGTNPSAEQPNASPDPASSVGPPPTGQLI